MAPARTIREKFSLASWGLRSPIFFAMMALPPVESMIDTAMIMLGMG